MKAALRLFFSSLILLLCSCSNPENEDPAHFRVVNLSPDVGAVDVTEDGDDLFNNIGHTESSGYDSMRADETRQIEVKVHNTFTTLIDDEIGFDFDTDYTMFVFGFGDDIQASLIEDDNDKPQDGQVKLRVVNGSPSSDGFDVYIIRPGQTILDQMPALLDLRFTEISDYLANDDGDYRVVVTPFDSKVPLANMDFTAQEGNIYSVLIADSDGGGLPFQIQLVRD